MEAEPEIIPPGAEGVRVRVAHVRSLGVIGAFLALMTMAAALGVALLMLFGKALIASALVKLLWPFVFSAAFTEWVFGSASVPFVTVFLLLAVGSLVARVMTPASWSRWK